MIAGCVNPGSHTTTDSFELAAAYADYQSSPGAAEIDWSDEFDLVAEQTLGGNRSF